MNDGDRRFVFEILSPSRFVEFMGKKETWGCVFSSHLLQADSQNQCDQWINSLQLAISQSFKTPNSGLQNSNSVRSFDSEEKNNLIFVLVITEIGLRWSIECTGSRENCLETTDVMILLNIFSVPMSLF
jgi:hypothetical protein